MTVFVDEVGAWLDQGLITFPEMIVNGMEAAPEAFIGLLTGTTFGKTLVRVRSDETKGRPS